MASFICADKHDKDGERRGYALDRLGFSYPVENIRPTLHRDALENRQHGEENVVKVRDAAVGALPLAPALGAILSTEAPAAGERARRWIVLHHET